jgi:hypothetical protein
MRQVWLAPSDIRYLIDQCPRCWWMVTRNLPKPKSELPRLFKHVDRGMKQSWAVEHLRALGVPAKELVTLERVRSKPIEYPELGVSLTIGGYLDRLVLLEDDTYEVIDFKMTDPNPAGLALFARQLHGYVQCLEDPAIGEAREVTRVSLVVFDAYDGIFKISSENLKKATENPGLVTFSAGQMGRVVYRPLELDRSSFFEELERIAGIAARLEMPESGANCTVCAHAAEINRFTRQYEERRRELAGAA